MLQSVTEERLRVAQLFGDTSTTGYLLRSTSTMSADALHARGTPHVTLLYPEMLFIYNSALPSQANDGALWAGRGANVLVRGGVAFTAGPITAVLAPEISHSANRGFQSTPTGPTGQFPSTGPFQSPFFLAPYSADLPIRFGDQSYTLIVPGQSALYATTGAVAYGVSTENLWWGPGARNALLLSSAGEGFPHAFVRTARPLRTALGDIEAQWLLGGLTPSLYADSATRAQGRSLSGAAVTLRFRAEPNVTLGIARLVLAGTGSGDRIGHALDVFTKNENLGVGDTLAHPRRTDQLASVFARWIFPRAGAEIYGEFARLELPRNVRDFLIAPMNSGAYTLGLGRAWHVPGGPVSGGRSIHVGVELTNLEQSRRFTDRPPIPDYYTGRSATAGFTNRGQVLGAVIGPGSSSQEVTADFYGPTSQLGFFLRRVRNQNDALYRQFLANLSRHDVSLGGGVRAGFGYAGYDVLAELTSTNRLNYLYQNGAAYTYGLGTVDVMNYGLTLNFSKRGRRVPSGARER